MTVEQVCTNAGVLTVIAIVMNVLKIIFIAAPILAIVFIAIDFFKNVLSGQEDAMRKNLGITIKRMLWCVLVFCVPFITNLLVSTLGNFGVRYTMCIENSKHLSDFIIEDSSHGDSTITDQTPSKDPSSQTPSKTETTKEKDTEFNLSKDRLVLGHYSKTVNQYQIVVKAKNGSTLSSSNYKFESANNAIASVSSTGVVTAKFGGTTTITVTSRKEKTNKKKMEVFVVHPLYTKVKLIKTVTGTSAKTGKKVTLKQGTEGVLNGIGPNKMPNGYLLGDIIQVNGDYIQVASNDVKPYKYYVSDVISSSDAENFVNTFGFSSNTKYLFWTNGGTGTEYMFTGSKGKWKLYKTFPVNIGDAALIIHKDGSARTGVHFNYRIGKRKQNKSGYKHDSIWKMTASGSGTNPWHEFGDGTRYPGSHGCTRFREKDIVYLLSIYDKIKGSLLIDF